MNTALNLTTPIVVLPGAWNTAIFTPEWIARFLHNYAEGQEVEANILQEMQTGKNIIFMHNIGLSPTDTRLEIFARSLDDFPAIGAYVKKYMKHCRTRLAVASGSTSDTS